MSSEPHAPSPVSPLTELMQSAIQMHELFESWVEAGFTREEALDLLKAAVFASGGAQ